MSRLLFLQDPQNLTEMLRLLQDTLLLPVLQVQGLGCTLSPVHFQGRQPWRVSYYALFDGWLLLSLPSRCLRLPTLFLT